VDYTTTIYTTNGCKYCTLAKELLTRANIIYEEVLLDRDITREEVKLALRMDVITFPQIVHRGEHLGGLVETAKVFKERGLV
tara:strand:- start:1880 stop:2125 length:246 start_codon:yes stop_codon:yes gene_type:complete